MKISRSAVSDFRRAAIDDWAAETATFLFGTYKDYFEAFGVVPRDLLPMCHAVHTWAGRHGCDADRHLRQLCCLAVSLGHRFWQDPRFAHYVMTTVEDASVGRAEAIARLVEHGTEWLEGLWENDSAHQFGERLCALLVGGHELTTDTLHYVLPGHAQMFSRDSESQLLLWLNPRLPESTYRHQRMSWVCCAMAFGTGWWRDPQYRHLAHHVTAQRDARDLVLRILPTFRALA